MWNSYHHAIIGDVDNVKFIRYKIRVEGGLSHLSILKSDIQFLSSLKKKRKEKKLKALESFAIFWLWNWIRQKCAQHRSTTLQHEYIAPELILLLMTSLFTFYWCIVVYFPLSFFAIIFCHLYYHFSTCCTCYLRYTHLR